MSDQSGRVQSLPSDFPMPPAALIEDVAACIEEVMTFENFRGLDDEQLAYLFLRELDARGLGVTIKEVSHG